MEEYLPIIKKCPLFSGIEEKELQALLMCLSVRQRRFDKNDFIFRAGESVNFLGLVLSGGVHIIQEDFFGNRVILANIGAGGLFGEAFSCAQLERIPVSVLAAQDSVILFADYRRIVSTCPAACAYHATLIKNMLRILAAKNVMLTQKMDILTRRTTRDKLLAYLSTQARLNGSHSFAIPFNRQELAEYLSVDRSAMSNELSKMRREGLLNFERNRFTLLPSLIQE